MIMIDCLKDMGMYGWDRDGWVNELWYDEFMSYIFPNKWREGCSKPLVRSEDIVLFVLSVRVALFLR